MHSRPGGMRRTDARRDTRAPETQPPRTVASRAFIPDLAVIRQGFEGDAAARRHRTKNDGAVIYGAVAWFLK